MRRGMDRALVVSLLFQMHAVLAANQTNASTSANFTSDPFLQYQPQFAHSLPAQLLMTGVVLTLTTTLLIQLCFTWQYHWPLARINWILQFTGVCTLLINILAIMFVVLSALMETSKQWPYMFEYIAIDVPRSDSWSIPEIAAWYVMEACTSALASITHIQFLTFLYPSRLEARLVFLLLGPLAIVASIMTLLPISTYPDSNFPPSSNSTVNGTVAPVNGSGLSTNASMANSSMPSNSSNTNNHQQQLSDIIDAARNICNLTLSLLFTLSLLIWGFLVNRKSAWRTDGGTAAFGAGALFLALVSTGLNFLTVFVTPRFEWLPPLLWAVVLWQSFLGWWWWVGSASGIAARDFNMERQGRKEQKRAKRKRRKIDSREDDSAGNRSLASTATRLDRWRSSVGVTLARRRPATNAQTPPSQSQVSTLQAESIEVASIASTTSAPGDAQSDVTSSPSTSRSPSYSTRLFSVVHRAWRSLRQAHVRAARVQAIEHQMQLQMQLENGHGLGRFPGGTGGDPPLSAARVVDNEGASDEGSPPYSERNTAVRNQPNDEGTTRSTMWWWGPLKKWRLRDSTTY
ncbi:hypothetical protein JB92DRAFT_2934067 [Gautieria morchelliformis]|nr:hypothetical protein JB92DRAFT_2934067 [Gautieria morchelliformis]